MRIIVFFDLPVVKEKDRKNYTHFRNFLLKDGYDMLQFSVYSRLCNGYDSMSIHLNKLKENTPKKGSIRVLTITEKQFSSMKILVGTKTNNEKKFGNNTLTLF